MLGDEIKTLIDEYNASVEKMDEREKAVFEDKIWSALQYDMAGKRPPRHIWMAKNLTTKVRADFDSRNLIFRAGKWTEVLWERIDHGGISLNSAALLCTQVRKRARKKDAESLRGKLSEALNKRDGGGKDDEQSDSPVVRSKVFRRRVKEATALYISGVATDLGDSFRGRLEEDFFVGVDILMHEMALAVKREKRGGVSQKPEEFTKIEFDDACMMLAIKGKWNQPIDKHEVKKSALAIQRDTHPDHNEGSRDYEGRFQRAGEARDYLFEYNDFLQQQRRSA